MKATQVFVPGSYPKYTYVERDQGSEAQLRDILDAPGFVISIAGPSKSGKTVLVEKVVGIENLLTITGAGINKPEDVWTRVLDLLNEPSSDTEGETTGNASTLGSTAKGEISIPFVSKGSISVATMGQDNSGTSSSRTRSRRGLAQVITAIANTNYTVLVDDFHYMDRDVQSEVAKSVKEAVRQGVKVIVAAVRHRGDDVVRANPELRGRVHSIDLKYWSSQELKEIAIRGFDTLNVDISENFAESLCQEAAGSPQLMQSMCLHACFIKGLREKSQVRQRISFNKEELKDVLTQTSSGTNYRTLVDVLDSGPRVRGTERKTYQFSDGSEGDVYRAVLKAISADPPMLTFKYETVVDRTKEICVGETPIGSSLNSTCVHMAKLADEHFSNEKALDWDDQKQVLDIPDPYLLFYLRWSGRLLE